MARLAARRADAALAKENGIRSAHVRETQGEAAHHARGLAHAVFETLARVLPAGADCALLDFPDHSNVGDSAIWAGERRFLDAHGMRLRYVGSLQTLSPAVLRRAMPEGLVLIHGGGNFGTVWPAHQAHRERVLRELRDYRVVQLPQSLHFDDAAALQAMRATIASHPDFTLMVRDRASERIASESLGARTVLCGDSALLLHDALQRASPDVDCLVLARSDKERAIEGLGEALAGERFSAATADWLDEPGSITRTLALHLRRRAQGRHAHHAWFQRRLAAQWDRLAWQRVHRGCRLLSRGRVVVTDRLHAHILCTLLGVPHVVLDNSYGKISSFMDEWTGSSTLVRRAGGAAQAAALCRELLQTTRQQGLAAGMAA